MTELTAEDLRASITTDYPVVRTGDLPPRPRIPMSAEDRALVDEIQALRPPPYTTAQGLVDLAKAHPAAVPAIQPAPAALTPDELAIRERARSLRIDAEARRRIKAESESDAEGLAFLNVAELGNLPTPEPLIQNVLNRHTYSLLRGRDGTFKSFIALDWALHLATGKSWQGRATQRARVLYIAAEGAFGIHARVEAWQDAHGPVDPDQFVLVPQPVNMYAQGPAFEQLLARVPEFGLVIVDTLRRVSGGADENGSDMGMVVDSLNQIKAATDQGSVLVIAHTQKSDGDVRGFSGIEDDADGVWHAQRDEGSSHVKLTCKKAKDGPDGHSHDLVLKPRRASLVVADLDIASLAEFVEPTAADKVLEAMRDTFSDTGATVPDLMALLSMPRATVFLARKKLIEGGQLELRGQRLWALVGKVQSNGSPTGQSKAVQPESTLSPTVIQPESNPRSNGVPPLRGAPGLDWTGIGLDPSAGHLEGEEA